MTVKVKPAKAKLRKKKSAKPKLRRKKTAHELWMLSRRRLVRRLWRMQDDGNPLQRKNRPTRMQGSGLAEPRKTKKEQMDDELRKLKTMADIAFKDRY